jgi:hypothetical protein
VRTGYHAGRGAGNRRPAQALLGLRAVEQVGGPFFRPWLGQSPPRTRDRTFGILGGACPTTDATTGLSGRGCLPGLRVNLSSISTRDPCRPAIDEDVMRDHEQDPLLNVLLPDRWDAIIV